MEMTEYRVLIGIWLLAQIFIVPFIITDYKKVILFIDFEALVVLIIMYFGL